jgi:hypothetical protein
MADDLVGARDIAAGHGVSGGSEERNLEFWLRGLAEGRSPELGEVGVFRGRFGWRQPSSVIGYEFQDETS